MVVILAPNPELVVSRSLVRCVVLMQSTADDVQDLVNVGVVAYLTQLLDTGFFHADP
jgi:hypothetical protein